MQYSVYIDQQKALDWGLNLQQAAIFDYMTRLAIWAETATIDGRVFYHIRRGKLAAELPLVSDSAATYKRHLAALERAGVIEMRLIGTTPFVRITAKGAQWGVCEAGAKLHQPVQNCTDEGRETGQNRCKTAPVPVQNCTTINYTNINQDQKKELYAPKGAPAPAQTPKAKARRQEPQAPAGVSPQTWADWLALRKAKRAPVTETVLKSAIAEAAKANISLNQFLEIWCARGSQGLEASWLKQHETARHRAAAERHGGFEQRDYGNGGSL